MLKYFNTIPQRGDKSTYFCGLKHLNAQFYRANGDCPNYTYKLDKRWR